MTATQWHNTSFLNIFSQKESSRITLSMKTPGRKAAQSEISSGAHAGKHVKSAAERPRHLTAPSESRSQETGLLASLQHDCCWEHLPVKVPPTASLITGAAEEALQDPQITAPWDTKHQRHRSLVSNSTARGEKQTPQLIDCKDGGEQVSPHSIPGRVPSARGVLHRAAGAS